jgi:leader peptidase (prepilin peptidase) / N-methyltransferase
MRGEALPVGALVAACGLLGLLVGSFLNVVVWRVPQGLSVVAPASACPACATPIAPRDNVPVLSWLVLRGRCRSCASAISARYPAVEAGTAVVFAATAAWAGTSWSLPAYLYLAAIAVALALIDLDVRRLPDAIVLPSYLVGGVLLTVASAGDGRWSALGRAAAGMAVLYLLYAALAVARPGGMGWGDVKLAGVLGLYLGWRGWSQLAVGAFAAFLLGGATGVLLVLTGRARRGSHVPFGPFMLLGAALGLAAGPAVGEWYLGLVGL